MIVEREVADAVAGALRQSEHRSVVTGLVEWKAAQGLIGAISQARDQLGDGPFALHLGESISRRGLAAQLRSEGSLSRYDSVALMSRFNVPSDYADAERTKTGRRGGAEEPSKGDYDAGVYAIGEGFPGRLEGEPDRRIARQVRAALDEMATKGGEVDHRYVTDWWCYRGQAAPVLEMNRFLLADLGDDVFEGSVLDSDVQGAVVADPSVCIESSVVRGPVMIGSNTVIKDAFVGPYTSIGPGVRIEGAEVEHSVILERAEISHLSGRLESSLIGPGSRVFRDFRLPRALRLNIGPGSDVALQ